MTDEQFGIVITALLQLNRGFTEIARHIISQDAEICAIRSILEQKGLVPSEEVERARDEAARGLKEVFPAISKRRCRRASAIRRSGADPRAAT